MSTQEHNKKEAATTQSKVLTVIGIVLCVILIPMLIVNCTLIVKTFINEDEAPDFAGVVPLIVLTDSMYPDIKRGDLIFSSVVDEGEIVVGDVISFYSPDEDFQTIWTHQVVEIVEIEGKTYYRTKGINNPTEDRLAIPADKVVGKYTGVRLAGLGNVAMFMQTLPGLIVCVVLPIILFVAYDVIRRRMYEKSNATDVEALKAELEALRAAQAKNEQSSEAQPDDNDSSNEEN